MLFAQLYRLRALKLFLTPSCTYNLFSYFVKIFLQNFLLFCYHLVNSLFKSVVVFHYFPSLVLLLSHYVCYITTKSFILNAAVFVLFHCPEILIGSLCLCSRQSFTLSSLPVVTWYKCILIFLMYLFYVLFFKLSFILWQIYLVTFFPPYPVTLSKGVILLCMRDQLG